MDDMLEKLSRLAESTTCMLGKNAYAHVYLGEIPIESLRQLATELRATLETYVHDLQPVQARAVMRVELGVLTVWANSAWRGPTDAEHEALRAEKPEAHRIAIVKEAGK